jgi:pimeloyl-ACP methyl ester carboxylesterase
MLRGLTREQRHWEGFPHYFRERMGDVTLVLPDLPGSGIHHRETCPGNIRDMLEFVRADVAVHLFNRPVYLLGLSLGAMVALEWARGYPQECAGVVMMNTSLRGLNPFYQRLKPSAYAPLLRALLTSGSLSERESIIFSLTSNLRGEDRDEIIRHWSRYATELPVSRTNALRQLWAAARYRPPSTKPEVPLLILRGLADRLVDPLCSEHMARHWQLPMKTHDTAGHDLTLDAPEWVYQEIVEWLKNGDGDGLGGEEITASL